MPEREFHFWTYILSSKSRTLYVGITNSLRRRTRQHREGSADSFTARYRIDRLVYFEFHKYVASAISREKYLKHLTRQQKCELIQSKNPTWEDLYDSLFQAHPDPKWSGELGAVQTFGSAASASAQPSAQTADPRLRRG